MLRRGMVVKYRRIPDTVIATKWTTAEEVEGTIAMETISNVLAWSDRASYQSLSTFFLTLLTLAT